MVHLRLRLKSKIQNLKFNHPIFCNSVVVLVD